MRVQKLSSNGASTQRRDGTRFRPYLASSIYVSDNEAFTYDVLSKLARAQGGVRPHRGITVIPTCGAAPTPVMPQVRRTWGRAESREKPQVEP
jgi:hypothetical protein